jgi:hypothetical protein
MLPESPTFYKVTCVISMCCMATLVVLLVCVQPHQSMRFKSYRGQQLRANTQGNYRNSRSRDYTDESDEFDRDGRRRGRDNVRGFERRRGSTEKSDAELVQEILRHNSMLARTMECKQLFLRCVTFASKLRCSILFA